MKLPWYKGRYTLGDKLQQQVAATEHSMCTGSSTSCSNTLRRHVAATNRFVCTGKFLWKSLSLQQSFVAATSRTNSVWFDFLRLVAATKLCCGDKDFHKNSPAYTTRFVAATCRCNVLLQRVAATCRQVCTDLKGFKDSLFRTKSFYSYISITPHQSWVEPASPSPRRASYYDAFGKTHRRPSLKYLRLKYITLSLLGSNQHQFSFSEFLVR